MIHPLRSAPVICPTMKLKNHRLPPIYRRRIVQQRTGGSVARRDEDLARLEAVLWLADEPMTLKRLAAAAELGGMKEAQRLIDQLQSMLDVDGSAFQLEELAGGYQLLTRPQYYPWLIRLGRSTGSDKLSPTLMETLAIIAYRQPIMRADIEAIRGVHCGDALRQLIEKKLIHIAGRHDSLGRPVLYGTTKKFLQMFGLKDLSALPTVQE